MVQGKEEVASKPPGKRLGRPPAPVPSMDSTPDDAWITEKTNCIWNGQSRSTVRRAEEKFLAAQPIRALHSPSKHYRAGEVRAVRLLRLAGTPPPLVQAFVKMLVQARRDAAPPLPEAVLLAAEKAAKSEVPA